MSLTQSPPWRALVTHAREVRQIRILDLFKQDRGRVDRFSCEAAGLYLDVSKQQATRRTLRLLFKLAQARRLPNAIRRLFSGEAVNSTENRAALHMALRSPPGTFMPVAGRNVVPEVLDVLARMERFAESVRNGEWRGYSGESITDVVNIGIGGSDLGPRMVCQALAAYAGTLRVHFVANLDGTCLSDLFRQLTPSRTLFIITSKTFTTQETLSNAATARRWVVAAGGEAAVGRHFVAVSVNAVEVQRFGIPAKHTFTFWDWVGGRYSLWSAVGLPVVLAVGMSRFRELLSGAHAMDEHFRAAPLPKNMPVLLGLLGAWNTNFLNYTSQVVVPYAQRLEHFVDWLGQLEMESNGKSVDLDGRAVNYTTTPVLWGGVGTSAQHAFFQLLHQGPAVHPVDFILVIEPAHELADQHRLLLAHGLAQASALLRGKDLVTVQRELAPTGLQQPSADVLARSRVLPGNRPSNTLLLPRLDPYHLGALLALYEHRTYVQSVLWHVNAFDQFGVELGKQMAQRGLQVLEEPSVHAGAGGEDLDPSLQRLAARIRRLQKH
ncbi:MAG: glucose-6-phosphate isomerase [Nevskiales bacterium]|nr:glucose-6-phosphate isomerase [Nevskiales bacterium]